MMIISLVLGVLSVIFAIVALPLYQLPDAEVRDMFNTVLTKQQQNRFIYSHLQNNKPGDDCYEDPSYAGIQTPPFDEASQQYRWIRCKRPFANMNLPDNTTYLQSIAQQKEFFAFYITNPDYMLVVFMSKLGYSNVVQVKLINLKDGKTWKRDAELPVVAASHQVGPFLNPNNRGHRSPVAVGHCIEMVSVPLMASGIDLKFCVQESGKLRLDAAIMLDAAVAIKGGGSDEKMNGDGGERVLMKAVAEVDLSPKDCESLNFVWPVGQRRASVVHKSAALPVAANTIALTIGDTNLIGSGNEGTFLGGIDYTRGLLGRKLTWDWTTSSFYTPELPPTASSSAEKTSSSSKEKGGKEKLIPYGFHFSRSVYDYIVTAGKEGADNNKKMNVSAESVFFYNGKMIFLNEPVTVELLPWMATATLSASSKLEGIPRKDRSLNSRQAQHWRVTTKPYSDALDLIFKPVDMLFGNAHVIFCNVDYFLMLGTFSGVVPGPPAVEGGSFRQIKVSGALGVVEEMDALW